MAAATVRVPGCAQRKAAGPFALVKNVFLSQYLFMPMTVDQILHASSPEVEAAWKLEIDRRIAEIGSGEVKGVSPQEVADRVQKVLKR
jgi:hypothetical protein